MNKLEYQDLLDKYLAGKCNDAEKALLHKFYEHFQKDDAWTSQLGDQQLFEDHLLRDINRSIERVERRETLERKSFIGPFIKIAASIVIVLMLGFSYNKYYSHVDKVENIEKITQKGQKSTLVLSDGTQIRLNANSKISYPEKFDPNKREVHLEGEAFFDVARDEERPFIIKSGDLTTTVLGTSFNIKAFPEEEMEVTVATGKVHVRAGAEENRGKGGPIVGREVLLTPNQQVRYDLENKSLVKQTVDTEKYLAWKEGIIRFDDLKLSEAAVILERWYGVTINFGNEAVKNCQIQNASYEDENLYRILQSFKYFLKIDFTITEGNLIMINGEGCSSQTKNK
mgnify:CR=1 FL=1